MKNLEILTFLLALVLSSCSTSKVAKQTETQFRGDWVLTSITTDQGNLVDVKKLLDDELVDCLENSDWHLVANNESGWYQPTNAGCDTTQRKIKWYMQEEGSDLYFWFKRVDEGLKAKNVTTGYKMKLVSIDESSAQFAHEVPFEDGKLTVSYFFAKK